MPNRNCCRRDGEASKHCNDDTSPLAVASDTLLVLLKNHTPTNVVLINVDVWRQGNLRRTRDGKTAIRLVAALSTCSTTPTLRHNSRHWSMSSLVKVDSRSTPIKMRVKYVLKETCNVQFQCREDFFGFEKFKPLQRNL